jgi:hypothetical protein
MADLLIVLAIHREDPSNRYIKVGCVDNVMTLAVMASFFFLTRGGPISIIVITEI